MATVELNGQFRLCPWGCGSIVGEQTVQGVGRGGSAKRPLIAHPHTHTHILYIQTHTQTHYPQVSVSRRRGHSPAGLCVGCLLLLRATPVNEKEAKLLMHMGTPSVAQCQNHPSTLHLASYLPCHLNVCIFIYSLSIALKNWGKKVSMACSLLPTMHYATCSRCKKQ